MNFSLSDDQQMLRDSALRYLSREYDFPTRRRIAAEGGYSAAVWRDFAAFGWLAMPFPSQHGGLDGSSVDTMVLMEAFGRHLVLEPYLWSVVVGGTLLAHGASDARRHEWLAALAAGELHLALASVERRGGHHRHIVETRAVRHADGSYRITGVKPFVPNGPLARRLIVSARTAGALDDARGITLFAVDREAPGVRLMPYRTHDGQTAAHVALDDVKVEAADVLGPPDQGLELLELAVDHGIAAVCAEAVGSADHLVEASGAYLKTREQYGSPLARFQVLQHRLADMYVAAELSRSMTCLATLSLSQPAAERSRNASAARVQVVRAVRGIAEAAVQLHGGMGMSEELDIGHHLERIVCVAALFGDEAAHLDRYAAQAARIGAPAAA